jgi:hypothetical protein
MKILPSKGGFDFFGPKMALVRIRGGQGRRGHFLLQPGGYNQRCRLSWLINSSFVYGGGGAGSQPMSTAVHRSPIKLWRSNSIFNLWLELEHNRVSY